MTLAQRVIARRAELEMTQEDLAHKMGLKSRSSIAKIESGREVQEKTVERLAQALGVTVPYLRGWEKNPEDQAELEASILKDEDLMGLIHMYKKLNDEQKAAVKQMVEMLLKSARAPYFKVKG